MESRIRSKTSGWISSTLPWLKRPAIPHIRRSIGGSDKLVEYEGRVCCAFDLIERHWQRTLTAKVIGDCDEFLKMSFFLSRRFDRLARAAEEFHFAVIVHDDTLA